jgi:uncharacterized protein (TIGR02147 family)
MNFDLFQYHDYNSLISDWFLWKKDLAKAQGSKFTLRHFADLTGFKSVSYVQEIMRGTKKLFGGSSDAFAKAICQSPSEVEYFKALIVFQNESGLSKAEAWQVMHQIAMAHNTQALDYKAYALLESWEIPVLREILPLCGEQIDAARIAKILTPEVDPTVVNRALRILKDNNLLKREDNQWVLSEPVVHASHVGYQEAVSNYQKKILDLAAHALYEQPNTDWRFGTLTVGISEAGAEELKALVEHFYQEVIRISAKHPKVERVYQLGLQIFPVTQSLQNLHKPLS